MMIASFIVLPRLHGDDAIRIYWIYQVEHEQFPWLDMVRERYGQQTSRSDCCPKDTGQVASCLMRQRYGWCNSICVNKASICTLKRKG